MTSILHDADSFFMAMQPDKTARLVEYLRGHQISFGVEVRPAKPAEGRAVDVFYFDKKADMKAIQCLVDEFLQAEG